MSKRVLVIEDNKVLATVYATSLRQAGFQVAIATDGQAGLDQITAFSPDVVVLDLMLPKIPGVEVLKRIRADHAHTSLPVIVFSNSYTAERTDEVWTAGATQVLVKASCPPKHLVEVVASLA